MPSGHADRHRDSVPRRARARGARARAAAAPRGARPGSARPLTAAPPPRTRARSRPRALRGSRPAGRAAARARVHHRHLVAQPQRLGHVVRHEHDRLAEPRLQRRGTRPAGAGASAGRARRRARPSAAAADRRPARAPCRRAGARRRRAGAGSVRREARRAASPHERQQLACARSRRRSSRQPSRRGTSATFAATVRCGSRPLPGSRSRCAAAARSGPTGHVLAEHGHRPASAVTRRLTILSAVVLPEPLVPSSTSVRPSATWSDAPSSAGRRTRTSCARRAARPREVASRDEPS